MSLSFFDGHGLTGRVSKDKAGVWVDLIDPKTQTVVAPHYGHGLTEDDAVTRAVERYRIEQADWDLAGIRISLEFVPTITTSRAMRERVTVAFTREGIDVDDYERPAHQLEAERRHPDWKWAGPSLRVHVLSELSADEIMKRVATPIGLALADVRRQIADLPFGITVEQQHVGLAFKHDDPPEEMSRAMKSLPSDLAAHPTLGWDRDHGRWFDL